MKIAIDINDETAMLLNRLVERTAAFEERSSHGILTIEDLARMLLEDAALSVRRPGSWEGAKMADLLSSHGYDIY